MRGVWVLAVALAVGVGCAAQGPRLGLAHWRAWAAWTASAAAATVADVAFSRRCEARYAACQEANPLLPKSAAGTWAVEAGVTGGMAAWARRLRRQKKYWWALPLEAVTAVHAAGAASAWRGMRRLRGTGP